MTTDVPDARIADPAATDHVGPADSADPAEATSEPIVSGAAVAAGALAAAAIAVPSTTAAAAATTAAPAVETAGAPAAATAKKNQGPGAAKMADLCGDSGSPLCEVPTWSEDHLTFDSVLIGRYVAATWPQVKTVGGWRPSDPYPDHPSGKAVDIMMPNGGVGKDKKLGDEIAAYFKEHADEFGVDYILWRQQQWSADSGGGWKAMSDRGSPTANHVDHVHISVKGNKSTIAKQLIEDWVGDTGSGSVSSVADGQSASVPVADRVPVDPEMTKTVVVDLFDEQRGRSQA